MARTPRPFQTSAIPGAGWAGLGWASGKVKRSAPGADGQGRPTKRIAMAKPPPPPASGSVEAEGSERLGLVYDERMAAHEDPTDPDHPEQPARIRVMNMQSRAPRSSRLVAPRTLLRSTDLPIFV